MAVQPEREISPPVPWKSVAASPSAAPVPRPMEPGSCPFGSPRPWRVRNTGEPDPVAGSASGASALGPSSLALSSLRRSPKTNPPSASTPATDQMAAVVASAVPSASCATAAPPPKVQSQSPGTTGLTAAAQIPSAAPSGGWKIGPLPSEPIAACRSSRSGSGPASSTAWVPSDSRIGARALSASFRIAASSIGLARTSTAGICLSGRSTLAAAAANGHPFPITIWATTSCSSRACRMRRSEAKSAFFIPSITSSLSPSKATA